MPPTIRSITTRVGTPLVLIALASLLPSAAGAARLFHAHHLVISQPDTIHDDVYASGGTVTIRGVIDGDVIAAGGDVRVDAVVTGSVVAAGGKVQVSGDVDRSVKAAGGHITIAANVARDLVAAGGRITVNDEARIGRDVLLGGGHATLDGHIGRNVRVGSQDLTLGERSVIAGDVDYAGPHSIDQAAGATVNGRVSWHVTRRGSGPSVFGAVRLAVGLFILGLLALLLFPAFMRRAVEDLGRRPLQSMGAGLLAFVVIPTAALVLCVAGIVIGGWWIGAAVGVGWLVLNALGTVVASMAFGRWLGGRMGARGAALVGSLVIGLVLIAILKLIPLLGPFVILVAMLAGLGAVAINLTAAMASARRSGAMPAAGAAPSAQGAPSGAAPSGATAPSGGAAPTA